MSEQKCQLEDAAYRNDFASVETLVEKGLDQDTLNAALSCAVAYGYTNIADYLITNGADLVHGNLDPVYWACHNGNELAVKYVLSKGISVNAQQGLILWMSL